MTIAEQVPQNSYVGDGIEDTFAYTFRILENNDLVITVDNVLQVESADYTLQNQLENSGNVVFEAGSIPADTLIVELNRDTDESQNTVYTPFDPFPADSHEDALDKLTMLIQEINVGGGPDDATYLRLDTTNSPLTGDLITRNLEPTTPDDHSIGKIDNRYKVIFGSIGAFVDSDGTIDIDSPLDTHGGLIVGLQSGPGTRRHILTGAIDSPAIAAMGNVIAGNADDTAEIESSGNDSFAMGTANAYGGNSTARVEAAQRNAFALGHARAAGADSIAQISSRGISSFASGYATTYGGTGGDSQIIARSQSSFAFGKTISYNGSFSVVESASYVAFAFGYATGFSGVGDAIVRASGYVSFAFGYAVPGASAAQVLASGNCSFAFGRAGNGQTISATAVNCGQFGVGTNGQAESWQVGGNIRIKGTDGAPTSNLHDGDMWVANNFTYIRSNGVSVQIT